MKKSKKDKQLVEFMCEGCADHVCNDDCGCELSDAAKLSKLRDLNK